jgi:glutamate/tyrosine decarboxylase-like PLP-dependent enzyme
MINRFPDRGLPRHALFEEMEAARENDVDWRGGRINLYTHFGGEDVLEIAKDASRMFFSENALGAAAFPSLKKFETDVVTWTLGLLSGGDDAVGNITSGGTESIFMALKTARDWAKSVKSEVEVPEIIAAYSAHPAINKAAHYLDMKVTRVPLRADLRADLEAMAEAIGPDTIMLVGSAPQFPHGLFDPIGELGALATEKDLWLHVDACVGGFIAPFVRKLGYPIPEFDFSVPGVTSMSADLHKYGFTAKGASTVLFHDESLRQYQMFAFDDWCRGHYASPTFAGTRPGGPIAAAWAVLRYLGTEGYMHIAGQIMAAVGKMAKGIKAIGGLSLVCEPDLTIISFTADDFDIFAVAKAMGARGWFVARSAEPPSIHLGMLTLAHVPIIDEYLDDLAKCVDEVRVGKYTAESTEVTYGG